jgi:hypothetical protein
MTARKSKDTSNSVPTDKPKPIISLAEEISQSYLQADKSKSYVIEHYSCQAGKTINRTYPTLEAAIGDYLLALKCLLQYGGDDDYLNLNDDDGDCILELTKRNDNMY